VDPNLTFFPTKSIPMVGYNHTSSIYILFALISVMSESLNQGSLADSRVAQQNYLEVLLGRFRL